MGALLKITLTSAICEAVVGKGLMELMRETLMPVAVAHSSTSGKNNFKCSGCTLTFKSEKLLEKHYFANHEFQCKFCDQKMDKDVYGDHLRQHLASQRKQK